MKRFPFSSLRVRLALLIFLAIVPVMGVALHAYLEEQELVQAHVEDDLHRIAKFAAASQEQLIEGTRQLLIALTKLPEVRVVNGNLCGDYFAELLDEYPRYANLGAIGPDGQLFCSAVPITQPVNFADQFWFRHAVWTRGFAMGACQKGHTTGKATLNISYPVLNGFRDVEAVVFAAVDLDELNQLGSQVPLPALAEFLMITRTGTVLARLPEPGTWVGTSQSNVPIVKTALEKGEGVGEAVGLDGVTRLYAFTPLSSTVDTGLYVCLGIPLSVVYKEANDELLHDFGGLGLVIVLALGSVWYGSKILILRQVNALSLAARQLSGGDMKARTGLAYGPGELDSLARTFDEMGEALEAQAVQLRQAEAKYRTLVEQMPAITYTAMPDESRTTLYISPQVEAILGFPPDQWTTDPGLWMKQIHEDDFAAVMECLKKSRVGRSPFHCEYRFVSRDGRTLWLDDEALLVEDELGSTEYLQGVIRDITENREAEEKLIVYQNQLRSLASQLSLAEERERRRIATELHDRVGQALAISKIKLGELRQAASCEQFASSIDIIRKYVEDAIQDTRSLIFEISSPILYELGFESALEWLTEQMQKLHSIEATYMDDGARKVMDDDIRVLLFQAVNELLVNVVKHARAKSVKVVSRKEGSDIVVVVEDDGIGFDITQIGSRWGKNQGFGLFSIRERLNHVNGHLAVESTPGRGTRITLTAPLT